MKELQIFKNESFGEVRVAGTPEQPLFCLMDVCKVLELRQGDVVRRLSEGVVSTQPLETTGGLQQANFVNEDGLYDVVLDSRKPEAKRFRKWITSEVLPSIRKHGAYMTEDALEQALTSPDFLIKLATNLKEEKEARLLAESRASELKELTTQQAPKVLFADAVATSNKTCLIGELAKILHQNGISIGQNRLFKWLRDNGYLCSRGDLYNQPTQKAMDLRLFVIKKTTITKPDGTVLVTTTTKVTGEGQIYFVNKFLKDKAA